LVVGKTASVGKQPYYMAHLKKKPLGTVLAIGKAHIH